jgi:hypothetical protein
VGGGVAILDTPVTLKFCLISSLHNLDPTKPVQPVTNACRLVISTLFSAAFKPARFIIAIEI